MQPALEVYYINSSFSDLWNSIQKWTSHRQSSREQIKDFGLTNSSDFNYCLLVTFSCSHLYLLELYIYERKETTIK